MADHDPNGIVRECVSCRRCYPSNVQFCRDCMIELAGIETIPYVIDSKYKLRNVIAHGSSGVTFIATDKDGTERVVKLIRASVIADPRAGDRFQQEAPIALGFRHHNVASVIDFGQLPDASAFLASDYVRGVTLRHEMRRRGKIDPAEAIRLLAGICEGLDAAHKAGLVHRDLKPESIVLAHSQPDSSSEATTTPTIVSFNLTRIAVGRQFVAGTTARLQGLGYLPLRPNYISPEQFRGEEADLRSDIFSLGVIAYEMLTGTLPFTGKRVSDFGASLLTQRPAPIRQHNPAVNPILELEILRALEKDPASRPQRALEFKRDLIAAGQAG